MSSNVEVVVSDQPAMATVRECLSSVRGVKFATTPTNDRTRHILLLWLSALEAPDGRRRLECFLSDAWSTAKDAPAVFIGEFRSGKTYQLVQFLQAFADLSSRVGRRRLDPYIAADPAALRRLVMACQANAEQHLMASAAVEDGKLVAWSCEPRRYEVAISEIPAVAEMNPSGLKEFQLSSTGSRIRWAAGDVDLDLDTIRAYADPIIRRQHQAELREEASRYADAIRRLRVEKGLTQSDVAGLSERQVRRLEEGGSIPHSATLAKLAAAHGLSTDEYLAELAQRSTASRKSGRRARPRS